MARKRKKISKIVNKGSRRDYTKGSSVRQTRREKFDLVYTPSGEVLKDFMKDEAFFRGIRGPVGSGKSVACCIEILRRAMQQAPNKDGIRRTRWAVIRNTNPQLKTTTIKTWLDWLPEDVWGKFGWSVPYHHHIKRGDIDMEVLFLALDRPEDVKKLLSLELTGVFINEAREVAKPIIDACTMRVGRFPSMCDGGPTWSGVIADTNAPEDDHWWPIMAGETPIPDYIPEADRLTLIKPSDWSFFVQPPAMLEQKSDDGVIVGYELNPERENRDYISEEYYSRLIGGKQKGWIDVYVLNRLGMIEDGKPVYPMYNDDMHTSSEDLLPSPELPLFVGLDFGLTPAAVFAQRMPNGRWMVLHEIVATDMGTVRFAELLKYELSSRFAGIPKEKVSIYGDPAGDFRAQTDETTPFQILRANGLIATPTLSNDPVVRIESVEAVLNRMVDGAVGCLFDASCAVLRKGFMGGYHYRRMNVTGATRYDSKPDKNKFSHVHDALQYLFLGAGEGRQLLSGGQSVAPVVAARGGYDPFRRRENRPRRQSIFDRR